ncbi:MAG TPA: NAD(P)-dependent alcohol dehydrogenase [Candidatus Limnocylindrales bacterium]|nr:NAD(P)-dependent alcohol dehydrogenase [Candidatus Limnocylindrales bacterium]
MRAVVYDRYGPPEVLRLAEVDAPTPADGELLVRVQATAVTRADCATRDANRRSGIGVSLISRSISGIRRPRQPILGSEFAGTVEAVGSGVQAFRPGERVFGTTGFKFGAYAELVSVPESAPIAMMPDGMAFADAASVTDGGLNALWCLRQGGIQAGQRVLIYGGSGAIGTAGIQLARQFDADVTAVCSTRHVDLVRSLGADRVIDYTHDDFRANGQAYDLIFDAVGKLSFAGCRRSLRPGGSYLATDGLRNLPLALVTAHGGLRKVKFSIPPRYTQADVLLLKELLEAGAYRPIVDRTYPLEDVVEATRYVETERKTGNVVLVKMQATTGD